VVKVGNGAVVKNPDQATYHYGDVVTLTATADAGWTFEGWSGSDCGGMGQCVVMMDATKSVTATFTQTPNPVPALTGLSPTTATVGSPAFTLVVTGMNFVSDSTVYWNGSARATTFVNSGRLDAAISTGDITAIGQIGVTVVNPAPGGGTSNTLFFTVVIRPATVGDYKLYLPMVAGNYVSAPGLGSANHGQ
jgi:hypothetical protein